MIYVYDKKTARGNFDNNGLAVLDECLMAEINQELNGDYSLEIEYPAQSKKAQYLEELNIIKKLKSAYPKSPTIEPTLLPYLSEIGPPKICPIANPIKNIDKDSSTL